MDDHNETDRGGGRESRYAQESWTAGTYGDRPQLSAKRIRGTASEGALGSTPKDDSWHTHSEEEPGQPGGWRETLRRLFGR